MYFTSLPDHTKLGFDEQLHFSKFTRHNMVFNTESNSSHCDHHVGCLSFKTVLRGEEWYGVNNRRLAIRPGQFLILNNDQPYSFRIENIPTRSLSIFFKKEFASAAFRDALMSDAALLDAPIGATSTPEFFQTLYRMDPRLQMQLSDLLSFLEGGGFDPWKTDEHLVFLLRHLLQAHQSEVNWSRKINAVKASTKKEMYKRLCIVRDVLHSDYVHHLDLETLSQTACLSVPQLIRQFKSVFACTPYQYLIRIRLQRAAELLRTTGKPVQEITWLCGFENTSAFCRAFRSAFGTQPGSFRSNG